MNIVGLTMLTDPEHREDPWRESIAQALEICDRVVVVCGAVGDDVMVARAFEGRPVATVYLHWPQPEWSYEELSRHLNAGLELARAFDPDWILRFDTDCFIHEKDRADLRASLANLKARKIALGSLEKYQHFLWFRAFEKGKMPLALNADFDIVYGQVKGQYTDLCQPMFPTGETTRAPGGTYGIPLGTKIDSAAAVAAHVWNYDYTNKTRERATELLYHFDRSHARWWGNGYGGRKLEDITPESAFVEFIALARGRVKKCVKDHPLRVHSKHAQEFIRRLGPEHFGTDLWGLIDHGYARPDNR